MGIMRKISISNKRLRRVQVRSCVAEEKWRVENFKNN